VSHTHKDDKRFKRLKKRAPRPSPQSAEKGGHRNLLREAIEEKEREDHAEEA
jgi:hypothetical protein